MTHDDNDDKNHGNVDKQSFHCPRWANELSWYFPRLCDLLDGKGGGKGRFNAKINKLKNISQIEQKVKDYLAEREK